VIGTEPLNAFKAENEHLMTRLMLFGTDRTPWSPQCCSKAQKWLQGNWSLRCCSA